MDNFKSSDILGLLLKNKKAIIITVVIAGVLSFAGSFAIRERFKSTAIVYPINMYESSEESSSEQLLQYFYSEDVKNSLAKEFKLYERYGIDTVKEKGGKALFNYIYQENFKFSPTLYESIELSVTDTDPVMAQKLNAALIKHTNLLIRVNKQFTMHQYVVNARAIIRSEERELDSISTEIKKIKEEYNLVDEEKQAKEIAKEIAKGNKLSPNVEMQAWGLKKRGSDLSMLKGRMRTTLKAMVDIKEQSYKYLLDSQGEVNFVLFVSTPSLPDKRCYPIRSMIVLVCVLSSLLFVSVVLIIRNRNRG